METEPPYVCDCLGVTEAELRAAFAAGARDAAAVGRITGAGAGCGRCRRDVRRLVARLRRRAWLDRLLARLTRPRARRPR